MGEMKIIQQFDFRDFKKDFLKYNKNAQYMNISGCKENIIAGSRASDGKNIYCVTG